MSTGQLLRETNVLKNSRRHRIYDFIRAHEGANLGQITKALRIIDSSADYHLHMLERFGLVKSERDGRCKHYYPSKVIPHGQMY